MKKRTNKGSKEKRWDKHSLELHRAIHKQEALMNIKKSTDKEETRRERAGKTS